MTSFHKSVSTAKKDQEEKKNTAVSKLEQFLLERRGARQPVDDLQEFERELHSLFAAAEAEVVGHEVERFDIDLPFVTVDGIVHQRVLRCEDTYFCASGPVQVMRSLYSTRKESERAICPMELQAGLVEGRWTPHAAKQATWVVSHLTPGEGEELYGMFGGLKPSKSSLDRLPKQLGQRWERERIEFEDVLRAQERVPAEAVSMAVSLDGVMVPMKNGGRQAKRAQAAEEGKYTRTGRQQGSGLRDAIVLRRRGRASCDHSYGADAGGEEGNVESDAEQRGEQLSSRETGFEGGEGCRRRQR